MAGPDLKAWVSLPGVLLEIGGVGVLLTGESGVGKSETALELVHRGHRLVADDMARFSRTRSGHLVGTAPRPLRGFLEVRGLGILDIRTLYGARALKPFQRLCLVIHLQPTNGSGFEGMERLRPTLSSRRVLDGEVPCRLLPMAAGRNTALLVETITAQHKLREAGHDATEDFLRRRRQWVEVGVNG